MVLILMKMILKLLLMSDLLLGVINSNHAKHCYNISPQELMPLTWHFSCMISSAQNVSISPGHILLPFLIFTATTFSFMIQIIFSHLYVNTVVRNFLAFLLKIDNRFLFFLMTFISLFCFTKLHLLIMSFTRLRCILLITSEIPTFRSSVLNLKNSN